MSALFIPNLYKAICGSEERYGNADEIGKIVGILPESVSKTANRLNSVTKSGWTISRVMKADAPVWYRNRAAQHYIATKTGEDPIMGDAEEVALLIDSDANLVRHAAIYGKHTKGWTVRKASDQEIAEFERLWA